MAPNISSQLVTEYVFGWQLSNWIILMGSELCTNTLNVLGVDQVKHSSFALCWAVTPRELFYRERLDCCCFKQGKAEDSSSQSTFPEGSPRAKIWSKERRRALVLITSCQGLATFDWRCKGHYFRARESFYFPAQSQNSDFTIMWKGLPQSMAPVNETDRTGHASTWMPEAPFADNLKTS